jgi:hypothetical protein
LAIEQDNGTVKSILELSETNRQMKNPFFRKNSYLFVETQASKKHILFFLPKRRSSGYKSSCLHRRHQVTTVNNSNIVEVIGPNREGMVATMTPPN